jgi:hypothetical protein
MSFVIVLSTGKRLRPALLLLPGTIGLVDVDLSASLCRVTQVELFYLLRLDDNDSEVLSCDRVLQILDLCAESQVLLIIRLRSRTTRWGCLERTFRNVSDLKPQCQNVHQAYLSNQASCFQSEQSIPYSKTTLPAYPHPQFSCDCPTRS